MKITAPFLSAVLFASISACACSERTPTVNANQASNSANTASRTDASSLSKYEFRLDDARNAAGARIDELFVSGRDPIELTFGEGTVHVANACNLLNGSTTVEGGALVFGNMASTMRACVEPGVAALDRAVSSRLTGRVTFDFTEGDSPRLALATSNGDILRFIGSPTAETRYGSAGEQAFLEVAAQKVPCANGNGECLSVRELQYDEGGLRRGEGEWAPFDGQIEGFTFEAGTRSVVRVKRFTREGLPAAYVHDMTVESEVVTP